MWKHGKLCFFYQTAREIEMKKKGASTTTVGMFSVVQFRCESTRGREVLNPLRDKNAKRMPYCDGARGGRGTGNILLRHQYIQYVTDPGSNLRLYHVFSGRRRSKKSEDNFVSEVFFFRESYE